MKRAIHSIGFLFGLSLLVGACFKTELNPVGEIDGEHLIHEGGGDTDSGTSADTETGSGMQATAPENRS